MIKPLLSVVVCTYNRADLLVGCLESLANQVIDQKLYEVIIVNNDSTDSTLQKTTKFTDNYPNFRIITEKKLGLSHSRNRGWCEARGEYVAYIDDDAKASPDWCIRVLTAFGTITPKPAAVGGQIQPFYEVPPPPWFTDEFEVRTWGEKAGFLEQSRSQYGFSGSNMAFQRRILECYGGFSTQYGKIGGIMRMGEDTELFHRIHDEHPNFWYDPAIKVYHWTPRHNCTISYRFNRSFRTGRAAIQIQQRRLLSAKYARELISLLIIVVTAPYRVVVAKGFLKTEICRLLQEIGYKCGFLFGRGLT